MSQAEDGGGPAHEPALRAPWPAVALPLLILAAYGAQSLAPSPDAVASRFGFASADPGRDAGADLVTSLFVHAGWAHAILNALAALAFASPVARRLGTDARGVLATVLLYLVSGTAGSLVFMLAAPGALLIGASGAISGLMGAASRLVPPDLGGLAAFTSRPVLGMAAGWLAVNLVIALTGLDVGGSGAPVAWQAHLGGYAAGLLLIGPLAAFAGRGRGAVGPARVEH